LVFASYLFLRWMERPVDSEMAQVVEADRDCTVDLTERHVNIDAQTRGRRQFDGAVRTRRSISTRSAASGRLASQELAFGPMQFQLEDEIVAALPTSFVKSAAPAMKY
jgi:hypothetical protein